MTITMTLEEYEALNKQIEEKQKEIDRCRDSIGTLSNAIYCHIKPDEVMEHLSKFEPSEISPRMFVNTIPVVSDFVARNYCDKFCVMYGDY